MLASTFLVLLVVKGGLFVFLAVVYLSWTWMVMMPRPLYRMLLFPFLHDANPTHGLGNNVSSVKRRRLKTSPSESDTDVDEALPSLPYVAISLLA